MDSINGSLKRLGTDYVDLYQAHRFDYETPLEETFQAFADVVRQGKALYIGVSEWTAEQLREGHALAKELGIQLISNQPQYSMLWRVIEGKVVPASKSSASRRSSGRRWRRACSRASTCPVSRCPRARARPTRRAAPPSSRGSCATTCSRPCSASSPSPSRRAHDAAARDRVGAAEPQRRGGARRRIAPRAARRHRQGLGRDARRRHPGGDRRGARRRRARRRRGHLPRVAEGRGSRRRWAGEDPTMASIERRHPPLPAHARAGGADRPHGRAVLGGEGCRPPGRSQGRVRRGRRGGAGCRAPRVPRGARRRRAGRGLRRARHLRLLVGQAGRRCSWRDGTGFEAADLEVRRVRAGVAAAIGPDGSPSPRSIARSGCRWPRRTRGS